jgi:CheY-like chemotaxis protein
MRLSPYRVRELTHALRTSSEEQDASAALAHAVGQGASCSSGSHNRHARAMESEALGQWFRSPRDIRVIPQKPFALDHDRIHSSDPLRERIDLVQKAEDGDLVRNRDAQAAKPPGDLARLRMHEIAQEAIEPVVLDLEERVLRMHGYRVLKARNGREALMLYEAHRQEIALLVLDALMPELTGIEAARRIRAQDTRARILLTTGYNPEESGLKEIRVENVRVLQKPYTPRQLVEAIENILAGSREEKLPV